MRTVSIVAVMLRNETRESRAIHIAVGAVAWLVVIFSSSPIVAAEPKGFYLLQAVDRPSVREHELKSKKVAGLSIRFSWQQTQPAEKRYDWSFVDREIARAKSLDKQVMLRAMAGVLSPDWLYAAGANRVDSNKGRPLPVPWDPVMLEHWSNYVETLGARYADEPALTLVHLSGPTSDSAEMHLPRSIAPTRQNVERVGRAWRETIDVYTKAFPRTPLSLNASNPFRARDNLSQTVSQYLIEQAGERATIQLNSLSAKTTTRFKVYAMIKRYGQSGVRVGFQMLSGSHRSRFGGSFETSLQAGAAAKGAYYEIYRSDVGKL